MGCESGFVLPREPCLLPCLCGDQKESTVCWCCECFFPHSIAGIRVILGHAFSDEPARCACVIHGPPKQVDAVNSHWLFPRGCSTEWFFLATMSQHWVPLCMGLRRSLLVSLSVANISLVCFYFSFLFYQWKKLLLRRQL